MRRLERLLMGIALLALASTAARADRIVYFKSGKAIVVSAVESVSVLHPARSHRYNPLSFHMMSPLVTS